MRYLPRRSPLVTTAAFIKSRRVTSELVIMMPFDTELVRSSLSAGDRRVIKTRPDRIEHEVAGTDASEDTEHPNDA
jgi:hypothetical protein